MNDWFEAEQRIERALQLSEAQRWAEALSEIDAALSINADVAIWHAQRGFLLEELGRHPEAASAYEQALELEPGDREVGTALGVALTRLGRYARSLDVFEGLARLFPDYEPAYCHRIHIYAELGQHDLAEQMFYIAQELDEACPDCFYHMGASLRARGKIDRAIYCWNRVLELDADYIGVNRRIGQAYRIQNRLDTAREYFLRELREDPGNTDVLFELADLALESKDSRGAAARFSQIVELDPDHAEAHFALGRIRLHSGRPAEALACFETVRSLTDGEPGLRDFEFYVGETHFALGQFAEARRVLRRALQRAPKHPRMLMLLADCLLLSGKAGEAADWYRRVLAVHPHNPFAHHKLAVCLLRTGQDAAALEHCRHALGSKGDYGQAMHTAAMAHLRLGHWKEARATLRRAVRHDPGNMDLKLLARRAWRYRLRHYLRTLLLVGLRVCGRSVR